MIHLGPAYPQQLPKDPMPDVSVLTLIKELYCGVSSSLFNRRAGEKNFQEVSSPWTLVEDNQTHWRTHGVCFCDAVFPECQPEKKMGPH